MIYDSLPKPLVFALAASAVVHSALVLMPRAWPNHGSSAVTDHGVTLQAALVVPVEQQQETEAPQPVQLSALSSPSLIRIANPVLAMPPAAHSESTQPAMAGAMPKPPTSLAVGGAADLEIDGQLLSDRSRLGDLLTRELSEFPVEVSFPVRLKDRIRVKYPPAALLAGREESVTLWIIVDNQGAPAEIQVAQGSKEFADAAMAAVNEARFLPAERKLMPIRYPIAIEFHFALETVTVTDATRPATRRQ
jgi:TonB family protein